MMVDVASLLRDDTDQHPLCKGCINTDFNNGLFAMLTCKLIPIQNNKQCPCSICLVKSMCGSYCTDFGTFWRDTDNNDG